MAFKRLYIATLVLVLACSCILKALAAVKIGPAAAPTCIDVDDLQWKSVPGKILLNGVHFRIKGINWFGLELVQKVMGGLNKLSIEEILDFLVEHDFNAIRLPFSLTFALSTEEDTYPNPKYVSEDLEGFTTWQLVDRVFKEAARRGIFILLDLHALDPNKGFSDLWYDDDYSEKQVLHGWFYMLERYGKMWNLMGIDIKNECHNTCSWGKGDDDTDFNQFAQRLMMYTNKHFPGYRGLFFVEGVHQNAYGRPPSAYNYWWGGNLFGAEKFPIRTNLTSLDDRVVYSPHIYGPDVYDMKYFSAPDFPRNLNMVWDDQFGWLVSTLKKAVVVGEWGGSCKGKDGITQDHLANWLIDNCLTDNFWWSLNPGSEDTGGLMSISWAKFEPVKMELLDRVQPNPTLVTYSKRTEGICITPGQPANPKCDGPDAYTITPNKPTTAPEPVQPKISITTTTTPKLRGVEVGAGAEQTAMKEVVPDKTKKPAPATTTTARKAVLVQQEDEGGVEEEEEEAEEEDEE